MPQQAAAAKDSLASKPDTAASLPKLGIYLQEEDSLLVPPFEINITLSPKAQEKISKSNETIIVDVFLQGEPANPKKAHLEEDGSFFVGDAKKEIRPGQAAVFNDLKFPKKIYDQLADKDVDLTVNVYTGRKSSPDNLITGDMLSEKVSKVMNKHFTLHHKLIYGDD